MATLLDGLYPYEVVLLVLGCVLFVVLLFVLVVLVLRSKEFGKLLPFFVLPIAMIGYPGIQSIEIKDGTVTIKTITRELEQNPTDPAKREELKKAVAKLAARPIARPDRNAALAAAQLALGDESAAVTSLRKAQRVDPAGAEVVALQRKIDVVRELDRLATAVERDPADSRAAAELSGRLAAAEKEKFADPRALATVARARAVRAGVTAAVPPPPPPP